MHIRMLFVLALCAGLFSAGCSTGGGPDAQGRAAAPAAQTPGGAEPLSSLYLSEVEGLHVTGTAVEVDVETFRLQIRGKVAAPLELRFDELRAMETVRLEADLVCPGFFVDRGAWTGVPVRALLDRAGLEAGARTVSFTSVDGSYTQRLSLDQVLDPQILVAFEFDDRELHVLHGFPVRLAAPGQPGNLWVKWLGEITVN